MANKDYQTNVRVGDQEVSFPLKGVGSVHLAKHTLIYLVEKLKGLTTKKVSGEIVHWDRVPDGQCSSSEAEVLFSIK